MLLIGSTALAYYVDGIVPKDLDLVASYDDAVEFRKKFKATAFYPINEGKSIFMKNAEGHICEIEIAWPDSRAERLIDFVKGQFDTKYGWQHEAYVPSLDVLYMLKMSHRYLKDSPFFKKTMDDIIYMRDTLGCKIRDEHMEFFKQREKDTYTNRLPKLNRSKEDFFSGDGIEYEWVHDDIHEAVKHLEAPAYTYFSGGEVWSDMKKFVELPEEIKLLAVLEESLVLAAERSQLAFPDRQIDPKWSFDKALEKVCSSITGGIFRSYAYDNYYKVQELYKEVGQNYMDRVKTGIASGLIRRTTAMETS